jgi:sarcosine oxidase subunit gamma
MTLRGRAAMAEPKAVSPVEPFAADMAAASWSGALLRAAEARAQIGVRARGAAVARLAAGLKIPALPAPNRFVATARGDCFWLSPEEWLVIGDRDSRAECLAELERTVGPAEGAAVDLSESRVILELQGQDARDVLRTCCPIDLHEGAFSAGFCAQTLIAKAPVLLAQADPSPLYRLYLRPSLLAYVVSWLVDGMAGVRAEAATR